jgi:polysaccharide biosynthesis transport protein
MLQTNKLRPTLETGAQPSEFASPGELYTLFRGFIGRQYPVVAFVTVLALALGAVYIFTAPAKYTANAVIVIDAHKTQLFQQQSVGDPTVESLGVDTQIEILKSENIATSVIKDLHLTDDPEFSAPYAGFIGTIFNFATSIFAIGSASLKDPAPEDGQMRIAVGVFGSDISIKRVGLTYAIEIDFQSLSRNRAAQVANAIADAYVVDELEAKFQTTRRASVWLQDRLKELREQSTNAEHAVNDFKQKNNIVDSGGRLLNEQQLAELNSALVQAQAQTAEAKARLDRVSQILQSKDPDPVNGAAGTVTDTLHNEVITKLRQEYLDLAAKAEDWTKRYGANHLAVVNLRNQMREIRHNILDELGRIAETYKSDYEISKAREDSVTNSLADIVKQSQTLSGAEVTLHDLEASAQTYRALYDNFLQRYMESVQQQSFPISDARVITPATRPGGKSSPKTTLILALATVGGLIFGIGFGFLREISDRVFRTTGQIKEHLDADCVAVVPLVKVVGKQAPVSAASQSGGAERIISRDNSLLRMVLDAPFSRFTESIRALKVAVDLSRVVKTNKVIAITSSLPNEGKSTIATTLAQIIAHSGSHVLLVDCDLRNPSLSRKLSLGAVTGLLEVISGAATLEEVVWRDSTTGLSFLPTVVAARLAHSSDLLASDATKMVFEKLREAYDYVIVDLSPLAPVVDVRAMTHLVDSFLFVVEWGRSKIDVAELALSSANGVYENLLGVVLNKADMTRLGRYESHRGNYYHNRYYSRYGYTD